MSRDPFPTERVYQAGPHTCVAVAREAVVKVWAELDSEFPDMQAIRTQMGVVRAWLPSWLERAWDEGHRFTGYEPERGENPYRAEDDPDAALARTMEILRSTSPSHDVLAVIDQIEAEIASRKTACHCGEPVAYGFDGDPTHHRDMCEHCDAVRCDAYPGECASARED